MVVCKRCHRTIKNPVSVIHGYGPVCWTKVPHTIVIEADHTKDGNVHKDNNVYMNTEPK